MPPYEPSVDLFTGSQKPWTSTELYSMVLNWSLWPRGGWRPISRSRSQPRFPPCPTRIPLLWWCCYSTVREEDKLFVLCAWTSTACIKNQTLFKNTYNDTNIYIYIYTHTGTVPIICINILRPQGPFILGWPVNASTAQYTLMACNCMWWPFFCLKLQASHSSSNNDMSWTHTCHLWMYRSWHSKIFLSFFADGVFETLVSGFLQAIFHAGS